MNRKSALQLLAQNGLAHTPESLQRLLADGRVSATGNDQQGTLDIDSKSLAAYIAGYREFITSRHSALFRGPLL